jgi:hypothetical protein
MLKLVSLGAALLTLSFLGGCGGGSSSPEVVASTSSFDVSTAFRNGESTPRNSTIKVTVSAGTQTATGPGTYVTSALSNVSFNGTSALQRTDTVSATLTTANQTVPFSVNGTVYLESNLLPLGSVATSSSSASSATFQTSTLLAALPSAAKVGDSGNFARVEVFSNAGKTIKVSTSTITWTLSADSASTALLRFTRITTGGASEGTSIETARITAAGAVTPIQVDAMLTTGRVVFDFL